MSKILHTRRSFCSKGTENYPIVLLTIEAYHYVETNVLLIDVSGYRPSPGSGAQALPSRSVLERLGRVEAFARITQVLEEVCAPFIKEGLSFYDTQLLKRDL